MKTTSDLHSLFVTGLQNAHAMENEALSIMSAQIGRSTEYKDLVHRLRLHIAETEGQLSRLNDILDILGEGSSTVKDTALSIGGKLAAMGHSVACDEILKTVFADAAFENHEAAAYRSLIALAEAGGYEGAIAPLARSLKEEEDMAS